MTFFSTHEREVLSIPAPSQDQKGAAPKTGANLFAEELGGGEPEELAAGWGEAFEFEGGYAGFF